MASPILGPIPSVEQLLEEAIDAYQKEFKKYPVCCGCAPGRVNLIGEHTDYNDGFVLPMALPLVTLVVGGKNQTNTCQVLTLNPLADEPHLCSFPVPLSDEPLTPGTPKWGNYVKGVAYYFLANSDVPGFNAVIVSSVPMGGGLSSSASLEVAMYTFLEEFTDDRTHQATQKALRCQFAEHKFANVPCGIMDQYISVMGKKDHALLIDCSSNQACQIPFSDPNYVFVITNSNARHELSGSEYPTRQAQCFRAAELMGKKSLRRATMQELEGLKCDPSEAIIINRARHVIGENLRTEEAAEALKKGDYVKFGKLMVQSHESLRDDFEVSCEELDELVTLALEVDGVLGSRMTGGGFGGCTVTLVKKDAEDQLISHISSKYSGHATFYIATPSEGTRGLPVDWPSHKWY